MKRRFRGVVLSALIALPAGAAAAERAVILDTAASKVTFTLGTTFHEVHGTMAPVGGTIRFDPETGAASGEITVDARSAETGNSKRDATMHADVLETGRFPTIVFVAQRVDGRINDPGRSELRLAGVMRLHGADHPMTLAGVIESAEGCVRGELRFPIPYVAWGMHDPSFFVARAEKSVDVTVRVEGRWADAAAGSPPTPCSRPSDGMRR